MATLTGLLRLFGWHVKLSVSRAMIYRADFLTGLFISILVSCGGPVVQYLYFTQTRGYPEWTLGQILLFQGLLLLWFGLRDLLFGDIRGAVMTMVWKGDFDRMLLKPYPPIGVLLTSGFQLNGIGSCLAGIAVTAASFHRLGLRADAGTVLQLLVAIVAGVILFMAITILYCSVVILIIQMGRISEMFDRITDFGNYPANIYPTLLQGAMVTFLPFAIWSYYPAQILLHRVDDRLWIAAASCVAIFGLSAWIWNRCLRSYTSAGG